MIKVHCLIQILIRFRMQRRTLTRKSIYRSIDRYEELSCRDRHVHKEEEGLERERSLVLESAADFNRSRGVVAACSGSASAKAGVTTGYAYGVMLRGL